MVIFVSIVKRRGFLVSEMSRDKRASDFVDDAQLVKFVLVRLLVDGRSCGSDGGIGFCLRGHLSLQIQRKRLKFYVYPLNGELTTTNVSKTSFTSLNVNGAFVRSASVKSAPPDPIERRRTRNRLAARWGVTASRNSKNVKRGEKRSSALSAPKTGSLRGVGVGLLRSTRRRVRTVHSILSPARLQISMFHLLASTRSLP